MTSTTITLRQPTEVISQGGLTHYINGGRCLQCNETETYISENGGVLLGTIDASGGPYFLTVNVHESTRPTEWVTTEGNAAYEASKDYGFGFVKSTCYCDSVYHPQGC